MRRFTLAILCLLGLLSLSACNSKDISTSEAIAKELDAHFSVGILLPDIGLGDQSFNDLAIKGLVNARENLDITWSYQDLNTASSLEEGLDTLLAEEHDVIIGVGYSIQELLEQAAGDYPNQRFMLIDTMSEVDNIDSLVFKENEGSYLAGVAAALASKTNVIGFVGGMDEDPIILRFLEGYRQGAQAINPEIQLLISYANTYSDDKLGAQLASEMIAQQADVLYAAAGYTGVGLLQEAQKQNVLAIGVDSDQYFYAEKAVLTSMLKNVDVAVYDYIEQLIADPQQGQLLLQFGIAEDGVDLAPIRVVPNAIELEEKVIAAKSQIPSN